ncbi:hypothetical protein ACFE04_013390 [Oxalis oulophora]
MESRRKPVVGNCKLMGFLPRVAVAPPTRVNFLASPMSPMSPMSPARLKGLSIIPKEARGKPKDGSFDATEPTSPKVSCVGQIKNIKHKKKMKKKKLEPKNKIPLPPNKDKMLAVKQQEAEIFELTVAMAKMVPTLGQLTKFSSSGHETSLKDFVPNVGQMKKFSSSRETSLRDFDWRQATTFDQPHYNVIDNRLYDEGNEDYKGHDKKGKKNLCEDERVLKSKIAVHMWKEKNLTPPESLQM